jgi:hypothetical protein
MGQQIPALPYQPGGRTTAFAANGLFAEAPGRNLKTAGARPERESV